MCASPSIPLLIGVETEIQTNHFGLDFDNHDQNHECIDVGHDGMDIGMIMMVWMLAIGFKLLPCKQVQTNDQLLHILEPNEEIRLFFTMQVSYSTWVAILILVLPLLWIVYSIPVFKA